MKNFIFSLPSLVETILVGDDQGLSEAREKAAVIGTEFVAKMGVVKEASIEDVESLSNWGKGITGTDALTVSAHIGSTFSSKSEPMLNGADNVWFGSSLSKRIMPDYDGSFMFGSILGSSMSGKGAVERDAFWDISGWDPASSGTKNGVSKNYF